MEVNKVIR